MIFEIREMCLMISINVNVITHIMKIFIIRIIFIVFCPRYTLMNCKVQSIILLVTLQSLIKSFQKTELGLVLPTEEKLC